MKLVQIWSTVLASLLRLGALHAFAASPSDLLPATPDPQLISVRGYVPEGALSMAAGCGHSSKADYAPPVYIFGNMPFGPFSHVAIGLKASTLGGGAELATPLGDRFNLRVGGYFVEFQYPFTKDGIDYTPQVKLESGQGTIDYFPANGNFHLSAGALYVRNGFSGQANVQAGKSYKLGDTTYLNSIDDPVSGSNTLTYDRRFAPLVLIGFGNLIPRSGRRLTFPVEVGIAYMGAPQTKLQLNGTSCTSDGCFDDATDPGTLANIKKEESKISNDFGYTKFYPVLSLGFAFRF